MKNLIFTFLFLVVYSSCTESNPYCGVEDPEEDIPWIRDEISLIEKADPNYEIEIYKLTYKGQDGFYIRNCIGCADAMATYYNCEGEEICTFGGMSGMNICPDFKDSISYKELLWHN